MSARLVATLARGGMAVEDGDGYLIYRGQDGRRTSIGRLTVADLAPYIEAEDLRRDETCPSRWTWATPLVPRTTAAHALPPHCLSRPAKRLVRRPFFLQVLQDSFEGTDCTRLQRAIDRFHQEIELSGRGQVITMNWDMVPHGRGGGRAMVHGQAAASHQAARTLKAVARRLGEHRSAMVHRLIIGEASRRRFAEDFGLSLRGASNEAKLCLEALANAYDNGAPPAA
ncbi:MAG: DUF6456 domain-containing protein [Pseudomonadota bacterium]